MSRLSDDHHIEAAGPEAVEQRPESTIQRRQANPAAVLAVKRLQLMAQGHDFELQGSPIPEAGDQAVSEGAKNSNHAPDVMSQNLKTLGFLPRTDLLEGTGGCSFHNSHWGGGYARLSPPEDRRRHAR